MGKFTAIQQLGRTFRSFVTADFEKTPAIQSVFAGDLDPQQIIRRIEIALEKRIISGENLLFFDEIQEYKQ